MLMIVIIRWLSVNHSLYNKYWPTEDLLVVKQEHVHNRVFLRDEKQNVGKENGNSLQISDARGRKEGGRDTVPQDRGPQGRKEQEVEGKKALPP